MSKIRIPQGWMSLEQVADTAGVSPTTMKDRLNRAKVRFATAIHYSGERTRVYRQSDIKNEIDPLVGVVDDLAEEFLSDLEKESC